MRESAPDGGSLFQQIGEVVQGLRALSDTIEIRHTQVDKLQDILRADLGTLRKDHMYLEEKVESVICVIQHDLEGLRAGATENARSVEQLVHAVQELRRPVAEIVALRARVAGLILGLGILGSGAMWLAEPVYRWIVEHHFLKQ